MYVGVVDMHASFCGGLQSAEGFKQHRFADAIGPDEQNQTSGQQLQMDVLVQLQVAFWESGGKVLELEHDLLPQKCEFRRVNLQLVLATEENISSIQSMADVIWRDHYPEIIGMEQVEYMLGRFYSTDGMLQQMRDGQQFYRVLVDGNPLGFLAIEARGEGSYFLNKLYIDTREQRRGLGRAIWEALLLLLTDMRAMRLQVNRQNYKAINCYFKVGFVIERVADFDIGDGYFMNDFVMLYQR